MTKTIKKSKIKKTKISRLNGKKLKLKKEISVYVSAYKMVDGKKVILANSKVALLKGQKKSKTKKKSSYK